MRPFGQFLFDLICVGAGEVYSRNYGLLANFINAIPVSVYQTALVIPTLLRERKSSAKATMANFIFGVIPPNV